MRSCQASVCSRCHPGPAPTGGGLGPLAHHAAAGGAAEQDRAPGDRWRGQPGDRRHPRCDPPHCAPVAAALYGRRPVGAVAGPAAGRWCTPAVRRDGPRGRGGHPAHQAPSGHPLDRADDGTGARHQPGVGRSASGPPTVSTNLTWCGRSKSFAALNVLEGKVIGQCLPRHRHQEFLQFLRRVDRETPPDLDLHLIVDNYATHKHPAVQRWLRRHPRMHLHFTPTSSSWLNLVERWFRDLTDKAIRRGAFPSVAALETVITAYIAHNNDHPEPFVWTAHADAIIAKVNRCKAKLETFH